ncbi:tetratricopeptide repeat protein [Aggregicoccus sp. 17bor-14]|uniref:tetratricopeptide repeat protein n=1 Tax=Myxococcaceae TaxID=31 RepID=UPI00129CF555|nr:MULTISPECIES: tetratricopeptide repeat protein [Myxococcaceae]MBF5040993.1 tetratricopeptide repeat protein [Simulacricoccus sp. 17bor-14]MRI86780.1 tetratricopeptide repeat protein [Aggregicoccus sp. 17bor-14]
MTPDVRAETESRAERALRRGDLSEAVSLYESLVAAFPADAALAGRLAQLRESLQPMELQSPKASFREPAGHARRPSTPAQEGERLFALGDYAGAAAAYRRALAERPDSELLKERLLELFRLAQAAPKHSPTDQALPREPAAKLEALLDRLAARRRLPRS